MAAITVAFDSDTSASAAFTAAGEVVTLGFSTDGNAALHATTEATTTLTGFSSRTSAALHATFGTPDLLPLGFQSDGLGVFAIAAPLPLHFLPLYTPDAKASLDWQIPGFTSEVFPSPLSITFNAGYRGKFRFTSGGGLSVFDAAREIYNLWGFEITDPTTIEFARQRVLAIINAAVQTMHARAHRLNYFNRRVVDVTAGIAAESVTLDGNVQVVLSVSCSAQKLREINTLSEFLAAADLYLGDDTQTDAPIFYHLQETNASADDNVSRVILLSPPVAAGCLLKVEVALEPPRYDAGHLFAATPLQIPSRFGETVFLPLCRHWAAADPLFKKETLRPEIETRYVEAQRILGLLGPPDEKPKSKTEPREAEQPA